MEEKEPNPIANPTVVEEKPAPVSSPVESSTPHKNNFNKSILLVSGLIVATLVLLGISLTAKKYSPAPAANKTAEVGFAKTSLSISDQANSSDVSGVYETSVDINAENKVTGIQLSITYDPTKVTNVDIKPGDFLQNPTVIKKNIDTKNGVVTYILGTALGTPGVDGSGSVATISFSRVGSGDVEFNFGPDTKVSAQGQDQSVLSGTTGAVISEFPTSSPSTPVTSVAPTK